MFDWLRYQLRKLIRPRVITNAGVRIDLGPVARTGYARSFYRDTHERDEREIVSRHLSEEDIVLELGAGMGIVTILCCQRIGSDRVHAFEANPALESALRRNFALNGVDPHLELRMVSLSAGPQEFFVSDRFVLSSRHPTSGSHHAERTTIDSLPLSDVLNQVQPTFLIVDIEGGEIDFTDPSLDLQNVRKICLEVHPRIIGDDGVSRLLATLMEQGFQLCLGESRGCVLYFERPQPSEAGISDSTSHAA